MNNPRRHPRRTFLAVLAVSGLLTIACGGSDGPSSGEPLAADAGSSAVSTQPALIPAEDRVLADDQNLVVRQYREPVGFDPALLFQIHTEQIANNIYSGLTTYDPDTGEPIPDLARSWEVTEDGMTYTFHLVDNAQWQDGSGVLTSADVKYSYERVMNPATGSVYAAEFNNIASIETPNDFTVVIRLLEPDANFLYQVGNNHQGQIVRQAAVERWGDQYARHPVGTGPFYLEEWVPNSTTVLRAHEGYFRGRPTLDSITFNLVTDESSAETALLSGQVDLATGMGTASNEVLGRIDETPGFTFFESKNSYVSLWLFGPNFEPFQDARVRRAFGMAIDEAAISQQISPRTTAPWSSIVPPWMPMFDEATGRLPYDPEQARALLAEAGYPDGFTVTMTSQVVTDPYLLRQAMLAEVGINMEFEIVEASVFNQRRQTGAFELSNRGYPAVNSDTLLQGYLHPDNAAPAGLNGFKYNNPEVTGLLERARATLDDAQRNELYHQVQAIINEELPYLGQTVGGTLWIGRDAIKNVQVNRLATVDLFPVYISAE